MKARAARAAGSVTLRAMRPDDREFLYTLYASTRASEVEQTGWDETQKAQFLRMQFEAQHRFYQEQFPRAAFDVIEIDGHPAGRLYLDRRAGEFRVIDIALLPEYRGHGIGGALMNQAMTEAGAAGVPVRIHVERFNPARHLYERLKFREIEDKGVYILMEWAPAS